MTAAVADQLLDAEDVRYLVEIGFIALAAGAHAEAEIIFEGVKAARPAQEAGPLGIAMVAMARGDFEAAVRKLRAMPPEPAALTYLGIALARCGERHLARTLWKSVVSGAAGTPFFALAQAQLAETDTSTSRQWGSNP